MSWCRTMWRRITSRQHPDRTWEGHAGYQGPGSVFAVATVILLCPALLHAGDPPDGRRAVGASDTVYHKGEASVAFPSIRLEPVARGLSKPVGLVHAGDGTGRLFVVDVDMAPRTLNQNTCSCRPVQNPRCVPTHRPTAQAVDSPSAWAYPAGGSKRMAFDRRG